MIQEGAHGADVGANEGHGRAMMTLARRMEKEMSGEEASHEVLAVTLDTLTMKNVSIQKIVYRTVATERCVGQRLVPPMTVLAVLV